MEMTAKVGVTPTGWHDRTVGDLIDFQGGSQPEKTVFSATPRPGFVRLIQIRDYKSDRFEVYAPAALLRRFCDRSDIMIGRYGPPVFQILRGLSGAYNVALIKAIPCPEIDREFAFYFLKQDSLFEFIDKLSRRSSGQTGVDLSELRRYPLPLPPLPEQIAIATALCDVDALIAGLERLIAKKRDIKQAAMQQLLSGQVRLPGFSDPWETKALGDLASVSKGKQLQGDLEVESGLFPHLNGGIGPSGFTGKSNAAANTIAISEGGNSCGFVQFMTEPFWCGGHCYSVIPNNVHNLFLYQALKNQQTSIMALRVGSGLPNVQKSALLEFQLQVPTSTTEQTAISTVLSDMDADLAAHESRLAKTRAIKQGMMQELLTGRTRLV